MQIRHKILVVDDQLINIIILEEILECYEVRSAQSGPQALKIASAFNPDLILLDIMMPGMDGYEVCTQLRENSQTRRAKIVMVSAKTDVSERIRAYELGADDYITKPYDNHELSAKVKVYLRLKTIEEVDTMKTELLKHLCRGTVNPLTHIIKPLMTLLDDASDLAQRYKDKIAVSYAGAVSLQQLFENAILLSAIKSGSLKLSFVLEDLASVVRIVTRDLAQKVKEKSLEIHQVLPEHAMVRIDTMEIMRVIENVMDNAIRFSSKNGKIIVEISEANDHFFLSILDQGKGMRSKTVHSVFQEFSNFLLEDTDRHIQWHGLNLSLAQFVISMHKGDIKVDTIKGQGTNITIVLPTAELMDKTSDDHKTAVLEGRNRD